MSKSKIYDVKDVQLSILKTNPRMLSIVAKGTVPTGGWSEAELVPYVYIQPPSDGIYDFDFIAEPPDGIVTQGFAEITADHTIRQIPDGLKGVRVHASQNALVTLLGVSIEGGKTVCLKGTLTDEGIECQTLRTPDNELYTLVGDLEGFEIGDEVLVSGTIAEFSFCMQGKTISVSWIGKESPRR